MAPKAKGERIKIEGVEGFEGEYPFDVGALTMGDLEYIETEAGVRANEFDDALAAGSAILARVIATIMLRNAGHPHWRSFREAYSKVPLAGGAPITIVGGEEDGKDPPKPADKPS